MRRRTRGRLFGKRGEQTAHHTLSVGGGLCMHVLGGEALRVVRVERRWPWCAGGECTPVHRLNESTHVCYEGRVSVEVLFLQERHRRVDAKLTVEAGGRGICICICIRICICICICICNAKLTVEARGQGQRRARMVKDGNVKAHRCMQQRGRCD